MEGSAATRTTHWEVLKLLGVCFSLLCRNIHPGGGSGDPVLCSLHIFFWGGNQ